MYPIPANATRIRYLESTGTQYVDTGIQPGSEFEFSARIAVRSLSGTKGLIGARNAGNTGQYFNAYIANSKVRADSYGGTDFSVSVSVDVPFDYVFSTESTTVNGSTKENNQHTALPRNFMLFTFINTNSVIGGAPQRVYSAKLYQSGVLVRSYVPLRIGQTGYLFDRVSGQLFGNAADNNAGFPAECLGPDTFAQGVVPTRMMAMGVRKNEVWPTPLYTGVSLVGSSVQNNNGILSGFTSSSYATMPWRMTSGATSLVAVIKIHHTGASTAQGVWGCVGSKDSFTPFYQNFQNNVATFGSYLSTNGSSWQTTPNGDAGTKRVAWNNSSPFSAGDYILKEEWDGTTVTTHRWTNGAWSAAETSNALSSIYGEANLVPQLGTNRGSNNPFLGTIDLNYTYLMRDGELWWEGAAGAYRNVKTIYPD